MAEEELKADFSDESALSGEKPATPEPPHRKPSEIIRDMAAMMKIDPVYTGNKYLDVLVKQFNMLAAHADAVDAFLDSQFE